MLALRSMHSPKAALRCEPLAAAAEGTLLLAPHLLTVVMAPRMQQRLSRCSVVVECVLCVLSPVCIGRGL